MTWVEWVRLLIRLVRVRGFLFIILMVRLVMPRILHLRRSLVSSTVTKAARLRLVRGIRFAALIMSVRAVLIRMVMRLRLRVLGRRVARPSMNVIILTVMRTRTVRKRKNVVKFRVIRVTAR